jgi:signal transduction histidine kinase
MPQITSTIERPTLRANERMRVATVVETLATLGSHGETLSGVAHDARNMVTALGLYCDLLDEPGVLAVPFAHYAQELRLVAAASRRLVEKLVALDARVASTELPPSGHAGMPFLPGFDSGTPAASNLLLPGKSTCASRADLLPAMPVANLAAELLANRNLLAALAGPAVALTVDAAGGARAVRLTGEDLTRILVNLVKNAAEAMPVGGRIRISLCERPAGSGTAATVALAVEDNGPGIREESLEEIFISGFTTRAADEPDAGGWPVRHRGLGLAITRSIVEAAGGRVTASNRATGGARFEIELPIRQSGRGSSSQRS